MIETRDDLKEYLIKDKKALGRNTKRPKLCDYIWKYEILLRKCEYYNNTKRGLVSNIVFAFLKYRRKKLGIKMSFSIPLNVFGKGLSIAHAGDIIVNPGAQIGDYCRIHVGVNIGTQAGKSKKAPHIGNNCYIGPGAKLFGEIELGNNIAIGANAVVNKSFHEDCITIAGVPAKKISDKGSKGLLITES